MSKHAQGLEPQTYQIKTPGVIEIWYDGAVRKIPLRLALAAPDLLEAAKQAESLLGSGFIVVENDVQARQIQYTRKAILAIIAKAEAVKP